MTVVTDAGVSENRDRARERLCQATEASLRPERLREADDVFRVEAVPRLVEHGGFGRGKRRGELYRLVNRCRDGDDHFAGLISLSLWRFRRHGDHAI